MTQIIKIGNDKYERVYNDKNADVILVKNGSFWTTADFAPVEGRAMLKDIISSPLLEFVDGGYTYLYRDEEGKLIQDGQVLNLLIDFEYADQRREWVTEFVTPHNLRKGEGVILEFQTKNPVARFDADEYKNGLRSFFDFGTDIIFAKEL